MLALLTLKEPIVIRSFRRCAVPGLTALALAIALLSLGACGATPKARDTTAMPQTGSRLEVRLVPGPHYTARRGFGPFGYTVQPQAAAWLETVDGRYLGTLFVTEKAKTRRWMAAPARGRPEALPVWEGLRNAEAEVVSAATAKGETRIASSLGSALPPGRYVVMLEVNRSYDWNETYTKSNSGVNGQPSLVYRAEVLTGSAAAEAAFNLVGQGAVDGADGIIHPVDAGITTALALYSAMTVRWLPE